MKYSITRCSSPNLIRLAVALVASSCINASSADVVWIDGQTSPLFGQVVSITAEQIELQVFENGQLGRITTISRSEIEQLVVNIDTQRLEGLSPDNPVEYRNYAEELASQQIDPSALVLARRLFLIAAANSKDDTSNSVCDSALAGLIALADSDHERRRLKMLRFLMGPDDNPADIEPDSDAGAGPHSARQIELMLELIHAIRKENSEQAIRLLSSQENRAVFQIWREVCRVEELDKISKLNRPSKQHLSKLLQIELQILSQTDSSTDGQPATAPSSRRKDWGDFALQKTGDLGAVPSFKNVTTMDPRKSVFLDGHWVRPQAKSTQ